MTPPTTPTPPCAECGPFSIVNAAQKWVGTAAHPELLRPEYGHCTFPCQRCGTVHVLRGGKLEREEKRCPICNSPIPIDRDTCVNLNCRNQQPQTPVRYNVTRFGEVHNEPDGKWVRFEDFTSERAAREAAEDTALMRQGQLMSQRVSTKSAESERDQLCSQLAEMTASRDELKSRNVGYMGLADSISGFLGNLLNTPITVRGEFAMRELQAILHKHAQPVDEASDYWEDVNKLMSERDAALAREEEAKRALEHISQCPFPTNPDAAQDIQEVAQKTLAAITKEEKQP